MRYPVVVVPALKVSGMALFPFILVKNKAFVTDKALINHERIHLKQQAEMLLLPFYLAYILNYLINLCRYKSHTEAYLNIVFEREAYQNERNLNYLKQRGFWFWRFYLK